MNFPLCSRVSGIGQTNRVMLLLVCLICFYSPLRAQTGQVFLVPPQGEITAGQDVNFTLFIHTLKRGDHRPRPLDRIHIHIQDHQKRRTLEAICISPAPGKAQTLPTQAYARYQYRFFLPQDMDGTLELSLETPKAGPVIFRARPMPIHERTDQIALNEKPSIFQPLVKNLSAYEPLYFLMGVDPGVEKSKFQFSFKYRVFTTPEASYFSWLDGFYMAYTQTSYWDLRSDSKPFDDTSYKPELFYFFPKIDLNIPWVKTFGLQTGFRHESNGQGSVQSRSTNTLYIEPIMGFTLGENFFLQLKPRAWTYVMNEDESNPDLDQFRGYFSLGLTLGDPGGFVLDTRTAIADKGPSFQADLTYPLFNHLNKKFNFYLHLQYFTGYAERLIDYKQKEEIVRLGLSIIR